MSDRTPSSPAGEPAPPSPRAGQLPPPPPRPPFGHLETNGLAIASLVVSVSLFGVGSIIGIVLGLLARREIARSGGRQGGAGLAIAGIAVGIFGLVVVALTVVLFTVAAKVGTDARMAA